MACSSVFGQGHIFVTKDLGQASCSLGVKGNEPNFGQTIYSSFLIWFTDSSSRKYMKDLNMNVMSVTDCFHQ